MSSMYAPTLSPAKHILLHNNPSLINQQQKSKCLPDTKFGFFGSSKRMCNYTSSSRKAANLYVTRCSASQTEQQEGAMQGIKCDDRYYMRRCVELAKKAIGHTSPNPMVGCVIVKDGKIVGEGFHPKAGQSHAEVFALRDAGDLAENATAYVSLEPCNHYGRTPPCTEALIKAKVKNVVIGMVDPNPIVASTGIKKLEDSGIKVRSGVEEEMCKRLNEAYIHYMLTRKPFVTLRYSISLDGHMLNNPGEEATKCGGYYSRLLQEYDALVLSSIALLDKSSFPVSNEVGAKQPLKIVLSKHNSPNQIPNADSDSASNVIIFSEDEAEEGTVEPQAVQEGIKTISSRRINLIEILNYCKDQGLCSVLMELSGNNDEFDELLKEGFGHSLFQKVVVEVLPVLIGGDCDKEREINHSNIKVELKKLTSSDYGNSVLLEGYF